MWTLILTLSLSAPAVASASGFTSEAACNFAGAAWQGQMQDRFGGRPASFVCVKNST